MSESGTPHGRGSASEEPRNGAHPRHSLTRNLVAVGTSQVFSWGLGLVSQIVQPRFLGPDGLGQIQLAFSLWLVAQAFVGLGTGVYLTLEMARDRDRGSALVGPIILLRLGTFALASVCMAVYAVGVDFDRDMVLVLAITGVTTLINVVSDVFSAAIQGMEQMSYVSVAFIVSKLAYTGVMVVVLVNGGGVVGLAWATTFNAALAFVIVGFFYRRLNTITFARPSGGYRWLVRGSAGFMASGVILVLYMQVDMVVMSLLTDEEALGWYTSADVLRSSMGFVPGLIIVVLFPMIGRLHVSDTASVTNIVHRAYWVLALAGVSMGFGLAAIAEPFAVLLFGDDFSEAGAVLAVFGLSLPLMFLTMLLGQAALATGREWFWNKIMFAAVFMSIAFDIVFVPLMDRRAGNGAIGGALGYIVTEAFMLVVGLKRVAPDLLSAPSLKKMAKTVAAGVIMLAATWPLRDRFLLIPIAVGAVVFPVAVVALRILSDDDRYLIGRLASRFGIRTPWNYSGPPGIDEDGGTPSNEGHDVG
jgi:O-antigen/teichoic acid export membrane protein